MGRRVEVQHFVANRVTRQYYRNRSSDLLGVEFVIEVPADTEFPRLVAQLDLFTRFFPHATTAARCILRVLWLDTPDRSPREVHRTPVTRIVFPTGVSAFDRVFRLNQLLLPGVGHYRIELRIRQQTLSGAKRYGLVCNEYFFVEKQP